MRTLGNQIDQNTNQSPLSEILPVLVNFCTSLSMQDLKYPFDAMHWSGSSQAQRAINKTTMYSFRSIFRPLSRDDVQRSFAKFQLAAIQSGLQSKFRHFPAPQAIKRNCTICLFKQKLHLRRHAIFLLHCRSVDLWP